MKRLLCMLFMLAIFQHCYSQSLYDKICDEEGKLGAKINTHNRDSNIIFNRSKLRDLAFCDCIQHHLDLDHNIKLDKELSGSFLLDITNYELDAYAAIDSFARNYVVGMPWRTIEDSVKGDVLDCVVLYNSKHLRDFIKQQDKYYRGYSKDNKGDKRR